MQTNVTPATTSTIHNRNIQCNDHTIHSFFLQFFFLLLNFFHLLSMAHFIYIDDVSLSFRQTEKQRTGNERK